ncbi:MAG TPA: uroporphyrinogen-III C-methyltransferase [Terriglobales bacterium]|nr:uroporphyrinogen-III C-methyltransferase [Terriglobales bacterium]
MAGKVFLVGAGPGDPELLTVKAYRLLESADVVLHDDLVPGGVLRLIPPTTLVRNVGKRCGTKSVSQQEINALLVAYASSGLQVVRLKSGDPLIFGRAGEEIEAVGQANIELEIVPGVTAALGAAAAAQVSLTHREKASAVLFLSGHTKASRKSDLPAHLSARTTLVIYMPGSDYAETSERLLAGGLPGQTACAIVSQVSSPNQRIHRTTIERLRLAPRLPAPTLLIVGEVAGSAVRSASVPERLEDPQAGFHKAERGLEVAESPERFLVQLAAGGGP